MYSIQEGSGLWANRVKSFIWFLYEYTFQVTLGRGDWISVPVSLPLVGVHGGWGTWKVNLQYFIMETTTQNQDSKKRKLEVPVVEAGDNSPSFWS